MDEQLRQYLDEKLTDLEARLAERIERSEANLLTAFHPRASPMEARVRGQRDILTALDQEVDNLKERVRRLEEKANQ